MKQIIAALLKAQQEMGNAKKSATNPFFKSKYSDLNSVREAVMPLLNENGIIVLQPMVTIDGLEYVKTLLLHESGETIESFTKILCKAQNDPQAYGSGVTYARRYGLQSLVCIGAEDDDAEKATARTQKEEQKDPRTPAQIKLDTAISEMYDVKSKEQMAEVWGKYKEFQLNKDFITIKDKMKLVLKID